MDTFVDSSWYFFRYCDPRNDRCRLTRQSRQVDAGGSVHRRRLHAVMHLIYTRFWTKFMRDIGLVSSDEPVKRC
jgi:leucyl-tRNA synthetase